MQFKGRKIRWAFMQFNAYINIIIIIIIIII